jgi:hypothetical protein
MNQRVPRSRAWCSTSSAVPFRVERAGDRVVITFEDGQQKTGVRSPAAQESPAMTATVARDADTGN